MSIGTAVPNTVVLHPLPADIVIDVDSDCEINYFLWGNDIVLVDTCSREVLQIIADIA